MKDNFGMKLKCTNAIKAQLPEYMQENIKGVVKGWWANPRKSGGLRLSDSGREVFKIAGIEEYAFDSKHFIPTAKELWLYEKHFHCPYYIQSKSIVVYDSQLAVMIALYGGIHEYLESQSDK